MFELYGLCSNYRKKLEMNGTEDDRITRLMGYEGSFLESSVGKFQTMPRMLQTIDHKLQTLLYKFATSCGKFKRLDGKFKRSTGKFQRLHGKFQTLHGKFKRSGRKLGTYVIKLRT
jgi:hypothetical protein